MLLANLFGATCFLFGGLDDGSTFGLSLVWCVFFIPLSFLCWFRPAYKAFRSDSSFNFMVFFLIFFAQFCYSVLMALGIKQIGGWYGYNLISHIIMYHIRYLIFSGLIVAISTFTGGSRTGSGPTGGDYFIGFVIILITAGWIVCSLGDFFMLTKVHL